MCLYLTTITYEYTYLNNIFIMKISILLLLVSFLGLTLAATLPLSIQHCSSSGTPCGIVPLISFLHFLPLLLHLISLLTLFAAAQSFSVVLEGGAPTVNTYAGKVSSDGTTLTLSSTAHLYMLNANGNAYQVPPVHSIFTLSSYYVL